MYRHMGIALLLVVSILGVYLQVAGHDFVDFDDYLYIRDNPWLRDPFDLDWLLRAFTSIHEAYWIPLTWLSYRLDASLYGIEPRGFLLTNVALHATNTLLVYGGLVRTTGAVGRSAFVAGVFALHPLHVESVAWASERKDVLSGFFFLAGVVLYAEARRAAGRRARLFDWGVAICLVLGLMAKPMLVTFPFALLLLDYWPLDRFERSGAAGSGVDRGSFAKAVLEKFPLIAIALGAGVVTLQSQSDMGGLRFSEQVGWPLRIANAIESYGQYVFRTFWPTDLAVFYPLDPDRGVGFGWIAVGAGLVGISVLVWRERTRHPYALAGWLWFVGNLVPVIGIIGVGMQARADRWTYIPQIGLSWIVAWGVAEGWQRTGARGRAGEHAVRSGPLVATSVAGLMAITGLTAVTRLMAVAALVALGLLAHRQVAVWRDTHSLFSHAVTVTDANWYAHHRLGVWYRQRGQMDRAWDHYLTGLVMLPQRPYAQGELGDVSMALGLDSLARKLHQNTRLTSPSDPMAAARLARLLASEGLFEQARPLLVRAIRLNPADTSLRHDLDRLDRDVEDGQRNTDLPGTTLR